MSELTVVIRPTADGTVQMTPTPGGAHYSCVDEATTDDADYVTAPAAYTKYDDYTFGTPTLPAGAVITRITVTERVKDVSIGGSSCTAYIVVGGTNYLLGSSSSITTSYAEKTIVRRTNPYTKCRWLLADLTGAVFRIQLNSHPSSGGTRLSQCYITVSYVIASGVTQTIRPNADKSASLTVYPASPTTRYDKIDEVTENTGDYVYKASGGGGSSDTYDLETPASMGTPNLVIVHAKVQAQTNGATTKAAVSLNGEAYEGVIPYLGTATEMEITAAFGVNPADGTDWEWADFAAIYAGLMLSSDSAEWVRCYQLWVEVDYTPTAYLSGVGSQPARVGYIAASADVLLPITKKRAQLASSADFGTILADTTQLDATETTGDKLTLLMTYAFTVEGTYYVRLGVRNSTDTDLTWTVVVVTVNFPVITSLAQASDQEFVTVTLNVSDNYAQPPRATAYVDDKAYAMLLSDSSPPTYQYTVTMPLERGTHTISAEIINIWAVVQTTLPPIVLAYELRDVRARILWGDQVIAAWNIQWTAPTLDALSTLSFQADQEITGIVTLEARRRGYESAVYRISRHSKSGASWSMQAEAIEQSQLQRNIDLQVKAATAYDLMQSAMGGIASGEDYTRLLTMQIFGQHYSLKAQDLIAQLLVQSGAMAWVRGGRWYAATRTIPASARLAWGKAEPAVSVSSVDTVYNRVRAHYALTQYPVPMTALTEADAANWTGTVTDVQLTDLLLKAPSGAYYMLRANGNIARAGLSIDIAAFDRLRFNWLPETASSMTIKLKQDASNYLTYTRTFAGGRGSGFIVFGTSASGTATKTITASIRPVSLEGTMTQPCSVVIRLKRAGVTVLDGGSVATWGDDNKFSVNIPASIYQGDAIDTIELVFSGLYPVNNGYGVSCTRLTIMQYSQVATVAGTTREIIERRNISAHLSVQTHYVGGGDEEWGVAGIIGTVPVLGTDEQWSLDFVAGNVNCRVYDYTAVGGLRSVTREQSISISIQGQDIWAGFTVAVRSGYAGADGEIASVSGGTASCILTRFTMTSTFSLSWQVSEYAWGSVYNLWDAIDIPLTSMTATGTTKTVTSIELTFTGINEFDALSLAASVPVDHVVEAITGAGDLLYPDEGQQYAFQSRESAQAYADGMLAIVSVPRLTYQKDLPLGEDVQLGEWVDCDGTLLQIGSISYDVDAATQAVVAGAEPDTLSTLISEQARQIDLLKRS